MVETTRVRLRDLRKECIHGKFIVVERNAEHFL